MSDQTNISLGKGNSAGTDRGLLIVHFPLSPRPDQYWTALFHGDPMFTGWPLRFHPPRVNGETVTLRVPDEDLEQAVTALRQRVQAINEEYEQRVLPELEAEERREQQAKAEHEQRLADAQKRLDELG